MKLNKEQIIWLLNNSGMFITYDIYKIFDTYDIVWICKQDITIEEERNGWYRLLMNGEEMTLLNFEKYPKILKKLFTMYK